MNTAIVANEPCASGLEPRGSRLVCPSWALALGTGALLPVCFPPFDLAPVAWIALVPLAVSLKRPAGLGYYTCLYLAALFAQLVSTDWIRTSYEGSGLVGQRAYAWALMAQVNAPLLPLSIALGRQLAARHSLWLALPVTWVSYEYARYSWNQLLSETPYPWLQLGMTQTNWLATVQVADLAGVWAVSALIAMVNGAIADGFLAWRAGVPLLRIAHKAVPPAGIAAGALLYGAWRLQQAGQGTPIVVGLVDENLPVARLPYWSLKTEAAARNCDLLLWTELGDLDSLAERDPGLPASDARWRASEAWSRKRIGEIETAAQHSGCAVVVGLPRTLVGSFGRKTFNSLALASPSTGYQGCYDKTCLIPYGEFTPWMVLPGMDRRSAGYDRGQAMPTISVSGKAGEAVRAGTAICFDTCFAGFFRRYVRQARPELFVVASCESADRRGVLRAQMLRHAQFRAIETRRPLVRNVVDGFSGWVDSRGRVRQCFAEPVRGVVTCGPVLGNSEATLYALMGDWLPWCSVAALFGATVRGVQLAQKLLGWHAPISGQPRAIVVLECSSRLARNHLVPDCHAPSP